MESSKGKKPRQKRRMRRGLENAVQTIEIHPEVDAFLRFMADDYSIDFQAALNTAIRIGMHQILAKYTSDKELSILKLKG